MERVLLTRNGNYLSLVDRAVQVLHAGGVILYPTDTVYGLGVDATNSDAVALVRKIKQRTNQKAILAMVPDVEMASQYGVMNSLAERLAKKFWPGPLSLIVESRDRCALAPSVYMDKTVSFRCPANTFCIDLTRRFGRPITSTSANISETPQMHDLDDILQSFGPAGYSIDLVVDMGRLPDSLPSTIIDARGSRARVVRPGAIQTDALLDFL